MSAGAMGAIPFWQSPMLDGRRAFRPRISGLPLTGDALWLPRIAERRRVGSGLTARRPILNSNCRDGMLPRGQQRSRSCRACCKTFGRSCAPRRFAEEIVRMKSRLVHSAARIRHLNERRRRPIYIPRIDYLGMMDCQHSVNRSMSKGVMDTTLERIHAKIADLEAKISDLRIAERELLALAERPTRQKAAASEPKTRRRPWPKPGPRPKLRGRPKAAEPGEARQTIGAAITEVLDQQGALSAAEIAEQIKASGRDINNRTVSFALQALKKRGLAKNTDGKWTASKARSRRSRSATPGAAETEAAS